MLAWLFMPPIELVAAFARNSGRLAANLDVRLLIRCAANLAIHAGVKSGDGAAVLAFFLFARNFHVQFLV